MKLNNLLFGLSTFVIVLLLINFTSADNLLGSIDNSVKDINPITPDLQLSDRVIPYNPIWEKYQPQIIKDWFGMGTTLAEGYISSNTESCGNDCKTELTICNYQDTPAIEGTNFYRIMDNGDYVLSQVRSYQWYYKSGIKEIEVPDYEQQCNIVTSPINGSSYDICNNVQVGTHKEQAPEWTLYNGEVNNGCYDYKIEGNKRQDWAYDFMPIIAGKELSEWSVWGAGGSGVIDDNYNMTTEQDRTTTNGMQIKMNRDAYLGEVYLSPNTGVNKAYLWNSSKSQLNQTVILSGVSGANGYLLANFTNQSILLKAGTTYYIVFNSDGSNTKRTFTTTGISYPLVRTNLNYTGGYSDDADTSGAALMIANITTYTSVSSITLNSPIDNYKTSNPSINFNCSANVQGASFVNKTLYSNKTGTWTISNYSTDNNALMSLSFSDGTYKWGCNACDSDGACGFSENRTITIDTTPPSISIAYPTGIIASLTNGQSVNLNYSVTDNNLNSCWYEYNGVNNTNYSCLNKTFTYVSGVNSIKVWANDTAGNVGSGSSTWTPTITIINTVYNATTYEYARENFVLNATGMTSATLYYNGVSYATTVNGNISSVSIDVPSVGNRSFYWNINGVTNTNTYYQNVQSILLGLCNATFNTTYLNISFADELTSTAINGTANPLTINYYLGSGTNSKTFSLTNSSTDNLRYSLCFTPQDKTVGANLAITTSSTGYPIRYFANNYNLTNITTLEIVYLLAAVDGVYQPVVVTDGNGVPINGATVTASNINVGVVEQRTTDSNGQVSLWLNPNVGHTLTTTYAGLSDSRTINPSSTSVYVTLGTPATIPENVSITYTEGVTYTINPQNQSLENDTTYTFGFTVNHGVYTINSFGFSLYYSNNTLIGTYTSSNNGGTVTQNLNVGNDSQITMIAYWISNGTTNTVGRTWSIYNTGDRDYSIWFFSNRLKTYIQSGMFGLKTGFGLNLICFFIVLITTGIISYKYGLDNPIIVSLIATLLIAVLELGLGLIDIGGRIPLTFWAGIVMIGLIIREGMK